MKILKFLCSFLLTCGLVYALNRPWTLLKPSPDDPKKINEVVIPPLGQFVSPFSGFWQNAESTADFLPENISIPNMKGKVKIVFDERLVPHIFAENMEDAVFAQGYITARYRLWQMDMISRLSGGRLAEVLGKNLVDNDKLQRRRGMVHGAENALKAWQKTPESYSLIESYVNGVNAYIQTLKPKDYPVEFKLLNYKPEMWTPLKTALVKKYMDQTLCFGEDDLESSNALKVLGQDLFNKLYPEYFPKQTPVIPAGTRWDFKAEAASRPVTKEAAEALGLYDFSIPEKDRHLVGSNNWAVAGTKTKSGKPILCNDPHLQLSLPSVWFEVQINSPASNTYGVAIPGIPGVLIGFNENIAWGETNVGQDVLDWYEVKWKGADKTSYERNGVLKKTRIVYEQIKVRGEDLPIIDTVRWTEWGPVVYESKDKPWHDLAMRWLAHDEPNPKDIFTFSGLNTAKNYDDYAKSMTYYDFPAQNFVFADKAGDIAITVNGKFPIKQKQQGRFVQNSATTAGWQEFIPRSQLPRIKNPARGFVASANQHSTDPTYPYYYNSTFFDEFRARHLVEALTTMDSITPEDMMQLQNDNYSLQAAEGLPLLLAALDSTQVNGVAAQVVKKLKAWDFRFEKDRTEPIVFEKWWDHFYDQTFDEVKVWADSIPMLWPESWRLIDFFKTAPNDAIFDNKATPEKETARQIATASFLSAMKELETEIVKPDFNWSNHKSTSIMHLARIPAFSRMNLDVGGYKQALNAISSTHGPSWRMVVALNDEVKAWGVFPGGQSGNPGSKFYDTGLDKWIKGEYNELFFMKNAEDERQKTLFTLQMN